MIRLSPSITKSAIRVMDKFYKIVDISTDIPYPNPKVSFVKLQNDKLDFSEERDFFFLNDKLLVVPLINETEYAIVRACDGSILCQFDTLHVKFVFNSNQIPMERAPDVAPSCLISQTTGKIYDTSVMSLIHLGATNLRLYPTDLADVGKKGSNKFILLGRPSFPALFSSSFQ